MAALELAAESPEHQLNISMHPFNNSSEQTVVEKECPPNNSCDGSDSGVEILETIATAAALSPSNIEAKSVTPTPSVDSSILSCCSNYDDAYNLLVNRNSTLIEGYKVKSACDGTSDNGSESSSVKSTKATEKNKRRIAESKKKHDSTRGNVCTRTAQQSRCKSTDRCQIRPNQQSNKNTSSNNQTTRKSARSLVSSSSIARTPSTPRLVGNQQQTDDGRWPSKNSKPAPLMSLRGILSVDGTSTTKLVRPIDPKSTLEKYATLPRRKKVQELRSSAENLTIANKHLSEPTMKSASLRKQLSTDQSHVTTTTLRSLPPFHTAALKKRVLKTRIFHETAVQTMLTQSDIARAFDLKRTGSNYSPAKCIIQKETVDVQTDCSNNELDKLDRLVKDLTEKMNRLTIDYDSQKTDLINAEKQLINERLEKEGLKMELKSNSERVFAILGSLPEDDTQQDSLVVLENKLLSEKELLMKQEHEISDLNVYCRSLQNNLNKTLAAQEILLQHSHEQKIESEELHEFLQAEKNLLSDSLRDLELENSRLKKQLQTDLDSKERESRDLVKAVEQKRQENLGMHARLVVLEAKSRELLVHQSSTVSGAAIALKSLIARLEGLVEELIESYNISEQELDDVIFHNEAYSNSNCSSLDTTPDSTSKKFPTTTTPSPKPPKNGATPSSFVSAVINAIKNATSLATTLAHQQLTLSRDELSADNSDNSAELLDSETEPCLMMEHVLEDVILPDTHSHNMVSSCAAAALNRDVFSNDSLPAANQTLLDQVICVDNTTTRLLKVIRIVQIESETYTHELMDDRDSYAEQANSRKETNKIVVKQLGDWEVLGAQLKKEVELLMGKLSKKNAEMDAMRTDIGEQRTEIEKLTGDVCDLSTALAKAECNSKMIDDDISEILSQYKKSQQSPCEENLSRLIDSLQEIPSLKNELVQKDKQLKDLTKEYSVNRHVLAENLKGAVTEARKQYDAIDNALETLHGIQSVVHQCPPLAQLQRDLEQANFQAASDSPLVVLPGDYNANAAAIKQLSPITSQ